MNLLPANRLSAPVGMRTGRFLLPLAVTCLLSIFVGSSECQALDPQRPLTQALLRIWQVQQGLPRAAIFSIRQTDDGYIWLGTQAGLYRFDGVRFTEIHDDAGRQLTNLWIQDLQEDPDHNLWIATDNAGIIRLSDGVTTYFGQRSGLPTDHVRCLLVDSSGKVWAGTDQGLARLDGNRFTLFREQEGLASNDVRALCQSPDGSIWIGGDGNRLSVWNGQNFQVKTLDSLSASGSVQALISTKPNTIWIGTSTGLIEKTDAKERRITRSDGLANDWVHSLAAAPNGALWIGTRDGISRLYNNAFETFRTRDGLSQSTVYTVCEDHEGSVWIGTKHGLNQFIDRRSLPFTVTEGLPSNDAGPIAQDRAGNVWVGTLGAGLARFDGRHFSVAADAHTGLPSNTVLSLAEGNQHQLWIGTDRGLSEMRDGQIVQTLTTEHGLPSNVIRCLGRDHAGTLWVGTTTGLVEYRDGKFFPPDGDAETHGLAVQALTAVRGQSMLVATVEGGLYKLADKRLTLIENKLRATRGVTALHEDQDGLIWTGVAGSGIGMLDGKKSVAFTVQDGLYDDDVFGIASDGDDRLWMACSRGIFSVDRKELLKFAAGETKKVVSTPFSPTDALRTIECQHGIQPAVWKMQDGRIWFSTIRGVIVIDPPRFQRKLPPPPIRVEEVRVNGKEEPLSRLAALPPGRTNIDFHYTALSLVSPTRITFRYMLDGFDKDWIEAGLRREAFYTNIPPGNYRIRVSASNGDGVWHEAAQPVAINLRPYFYQTRWFIPLLVLLSALIVWAGIQLRIRQIKSKLHAVLAERSRIARELHDTLIQGFSGVTMQMQALRSRLRQSPERETLEEIITDAGACLREARHSVAGLRNTTGDETGLAAAVARAARQITEGGDLSLHLRLGRSPTGLTPDVEYNILRIVQEATVNATKHSSGRKVEVTMNTSPQQLMVSVRDDGVGFDTRLHEPCLPGHYGLIGMRERAAHIRGELSIASESGRGTTVTLTLPLSPTSSLPSDDQARSTVPALETST